MSLIPVVMVECVQLLIHDNFHVIVNTLDMKVISVKKAL